GFAAAAILKGDIAVIATVSALAITLLVLANVSLYLLRIHPDPLTRRRIELLYGVVLLVAFWFIGYALALHCQVTPRYGALLLFLSAWALIAAFRAYGAYKSFAGQFAATVWRDYLAYNVSVVLHQNPEHEN